MTTQKTKSRQQSRAQNRAAEKRMVSNQKKLTKMNKVNETSENKIIHGISFMLNPYVEKDDVISLYGYVNKSGNLLTEKTCFENNTILGMLPDCLNDEISEWKGNLPFMFFDDVVSVLNKIHKHLPLKLYISDQFGLNRARDQYSIQFIHEGDTFNLIIDVSANFIPEKSDPVKFAEQYDTVLKTLQFLFPNNKGPVTLLYDEECSYESNLDNLEDTQNEQKNYLYSPDWKKWSTGKQKFEYVRETSPEKAAKQFCLSETESLETETSVSEGDVQMMTDVEKTEKMTAAELNDLAEECKQDLINQNKNSLETDQDIINRGGECNFDTESLETDTEGNILNPDVIKNDEMLTLFPKCNGLNSKETFNRDETGKIVSKTISVDINEKETVTTCFKTDETGKVLNEKQVHTSPDQKTNMWSKSGKYIVNRPGEKSMCSETRPDETVPLVRLLNTKNGSLNTYPVWVWNKFSYCSRDWSIVSRAEAIKKCGIKTVEKQEKDTINGDMLIQSFDDWKKENTVSIVNRLGETVTRDNRDQYLNVRVNGNVTRETRDYNIKRIFGKCSGDNLSPDPDKFSILVSTYPYWTGLENLESVINTLETNLYERYVSESTHILIHGEITTE